MNSSFGRFLLLLAALTLLVIAWRGCASHPKPPPSPESAAPSTLAPPTPDDADGLSPEDAVKLKDNAGPFGMPRPVDPAAFAQSILITRDGYALLHSQDTKTALWVAEHIKPENLGGRLSRDNIPFLPDPAIPAGQRAELTDYRGSGFDRGHMAPAGNQTTDATRKAETFYLSNMVPQHADLNRKLWRELEEQVRDAAAAGGAWTITGPMYFNDQEPDPKKAVATAAHTTVGANKVAVPTHTYKIILLPAGRGTYSCVAFVAANTAGYPPPHDLKKYVVTVEYIEQRTGLNFFPRMSEEQRKTLELKPGELP